ncbi:hypothetical protein [Morganella morganii]|uniref:hypothetical protein n=1 Tax=Morganella morganii TaxID=582 RepID=UPI000BFCE2E6|nr:hypothetical protein [Morganella morganii]EKU4287541.1 hypothetical protein [Morganella morganii]EKU4302583.1 hypothetical protein [Morganella morganii]EKU5663711.1 hypothetical protein [Morganella morganii]EKU5691055.1 hypothetical protein [Morganella morganii]EKU6425060.1 hypothetical protein [Morganella morganii]
MEHLKLKPEYREYGFIKENLEECLGFSLGKSKDFLPDYLKPYKTRIGIQLDEAANIFAGCKPGEHINSGPLVDIVRGYKASLWDAYDNDILSGTNVVMDYNYNEEYRVDVTLVKDQVTKWAKEHNLDWPFELPVGEMSNVNELVDLLSKIEELELENKSLKIEINELKESVPLLLSVYRDDDPLAIAIKLRNEEWRDYSEDSRPPSQDGLVKQIMTDYGSGMTEAQAKAIEKVACPIKRR